MATGKTDFSIGDRVRHPKLGEGDVIDIYPMGEDTVAVVSFEKIGQKKIVLSYAKLRLVPQEEEEPEAEEEKS
jgi:DNA helicase-2/ATP-dependent DNA helicase PcrA